MRYYFDSSVLVSLYLKDTNSERAIKAVERTSGAPLFTQLHAIEITNATQLAHFQKRISSDQSISALSAIDADIESGALERAHLHWSVTIRTALDLSRRFSAKYGCRTLDLMHLAAATTLKADKFITFDKRQTAVAAALGF
jgi:predicted nucleic acid-binding protein